jgi:hypothetical protein
MDPGLGQRFEEMAMPSAPGLTSKDLRLGALLIRKNRAVKKKDLASLKRLSIRDVDKLWKGNISLAEINPAELPASPGLIELKEADRFLYVSHSQDLRAAVAQMHTGDAFRMIGNSLWTPSAESVTLCFAAGQSLRRVPIDKWEQKLILSREPVFNLPLVQLAA